MRHSVPQITVAAPECPVCDATLTFTHTADVDRGGKVYLIFKCSHCDSGEMKFWRAEWQTLTDLIVAEEM